MDYPVLVLPGEQIGLYVFNNKQVDTFPLYKPDINRTLLRILRNTPLVVFGLSKWKLFLDHYETVIIFDSDSTYSLLAWVSKHNRNGARLIFCYRNSVASRKKNMSPKKIKQLGFETWSYNRRDCEEYCMYYYNQMLDSRIFTKEIIECKDFKYDVLFIGKEKGRGMLIKAIKEKLDSYGLNTFFYVTDMKDLKGNQCLDNSKMPYSDYVNYLKNTKCILDLVQEENYGLTYRPVEALLAKRKLITNYSEIAYYNIYDPNNIWILKGELDKRVCGFINSEYSEIPEKVIKQYTLDGWLDNF